jgi:pyruvyl transferase EpsO
LGAVKRPVEPAHRLLLLMRTDREANASMRADLLPLPPSAVREDWLLEPATTRRDAKRNAAAAALFSLSFSKMALTERYYDALARARVRRGMRQLASAEFVITDRLHVHILSLLMDLPHVVLDNSYGKITRFMDLWTKDYDKVQRAQGLTAAMQLWKSSATRAWRR